MDYQIEVTKALEQFGTVKRGEDTIVVLKDGAPVALRDSVREAHGERMPSDWVYEKYQNILASMSGYTMASGDDLRDNEAEIVDGLVDIYTSDLTAWLNESVYNVGYIDEAIKQFGINDDYTGIQVLQRAQYLAIAEIYEKVVDYLTDGE